LTPERPLAPFNRRSVPVTAVSEMGPYRLVEVNDQAAPFVRAGQFHMLATAEGWDSTEAGRPWLSRAISFLSIDGSGRIVFLIDPVGPGTKALAEVAVGDEMLVVGPLGNGFPDPSPELRPLLVGGGIGLAPILAYSDQLERSGVDHDLVLGFRTAAHASAASTRPGAVITTDDGSVGQKGTVLGPTVEILGEGGREVFVCGPPKMMDAVRLAAEETGSSCWLALESPMACGFGACFGCAVETREGIVRLCVDGPVLPGALLDSVTSTGRSLHQ
jgi:NAD(P)H-flavin reductase